MTKYETTVVFDGALPEETVAKEQQAIENYLKENAAFEKVEVWGKKPLAYEINKRKSGVFSLFTFNYEGDATELISSLLRYNDNILRTMTVIFEDKKIVISKPVEEASEESKGDA